jgi:hypothetical protein
MAAIVRVEQIDDGYDVVLADGDELVLAHYDADGCDICAGLHDPDQHARRDAERYAAQVRRLLQTTRSGR